MLDTSAHLRFIYTVQLPLPSYIITQDTSFQTGRTLLREKDQAHVSRRSLRRRGRRAAAGTGQVGGQKEEIRQEMVPGEDHL